MSELRKIQKVGHSTLTVSIPADYARNMKLKEGDSLVVREEPDGTLRLIPTVKAAKMTQASIKADLIDNDELLSKIIVGCYVLGYDAIELVSKDGFRTSSLESASRTIRRLRGVEIVVSNQNRLLGQSFMDPTKFPVDSLIKRLQILVSRSLEDAVQALRSGSAGVLNEVRRIQQEIDELYWLIVRQLLVALSNPEISGRIGLENPLHASGDRVSAKTVEEIGRIVLELTEEIMNLRETGIMVEEKVLGAMEALAKKAQECFVVTLESLLAPEIRMIEKASQAVDQTLQLEREVMLQLLDAGEYPYVKAIVFDLGQLSRYCNIIIEIALNRLLRKTSRITVIQQKEGV